MDRSSYIGLVLYLNLDIMTSFIKELQCPECGKSYPADEIQTICMDKACNSTLFAKYHLPVGSQPKARIWNQNRSMWSYSAFLPVIESKHIVSLGEGFTPIIKFDHLKFNGRRNQVYLKDESGNPTGSFKARGISAAVSKAKELGIVDIAVPTAGNAGGALAAYCAKGGLKAHVYMPKETPKVFKDECRLYGAKLVEVDGNISDCGALLNEQSIRSNWFQISTLKEPYRLEGKKTMGYEIAEQFDWILPDVILYPTGGGTGLIGLWKAFDEMEEMGWIDHQRPRMVAVQSTSCDSIVTAFNDHALDAVAVDNGFTIANGLRVPKSFASRIILDIVKSSKGCSMSVSDTEMELSLKEIAKNEGLLIAPEGAALWEASKILYKSGWIKEGEIVLLLNTGSGYKYLENIQV